MIPGVRPQILAAALLLGATGCSLPFGDDGDDGVDYGHELVKYDDDRKGQPNRYVNLEDGEAQLSIGSPDRHRIVVQWRDPDGSGWTPPETVWTDEKKSAVENTVRYGGGTVAIQQVYSSDHHSDDDTDAWTVGIVCRELACTAAQPSRGADPEAEVTPDGRFVLLGRNDRGAVLWTEDKGIHVALWSGHPGFDQHVVSASRPVLAPDGSLRVVGSRPSIGSCTLDLLASSPGTADLEPVGRGTIPLRGDARSYCVANLRTHSSDWVALQLNDYEAPEFWFVRKDSRWVVTHQDPSGLQPVDVERGCCDTYAAGFVHWNDVAYGSPDGRVIQVQTRLLGDESWGDPQVLDGAGPGYTCTSMAGREVGDHGYAVLMVCHSGKPRDDYVGDAYAVAATPDLRQWESAFVTGVAKEPVVEDDRLEVGDLTWTPDDGFVG